MNREVLLRMVLAQRAALEAQLAQNDALAAAIEGDAPEPGACTHPPHRREDTTTGGGSAPSFFCHGCKKTSAEIAAEGQS